MPDPWSYAAKTRNEYAEQVSLFMWANMAARFGQHTAACLAAYTQPGWAMDYSKAAFATGNDHPIPQLEWLFAIKNAEKGGAIRGSMAVAEGVKSGVPDIMLPVPMCRIGAVSGLPALDSIKHGLYIELKRLKSARGAAGKASEKQEKWHEYLTGAGYKVEICEGWELARDAILRYLGILT